MLRDAADGTRQHERYFQCRTSVFRSSEEARSAVSKDCARFSTGYLAEVQKGRHAQKREPEPTCEALFSRRGDWYEGGVSILARDVMKSPVVSVHPDTRLTELEDTLIARHIGGAPAIENGTLVGIVSRSDIVRYFAVQRSLAQLLGHRAQSTSAGAHQEAHLTVRDIMAKETVVVEPDTPIEEVARAMIARHVHRVLVTDGGVVVGLISALDVTQLVAEGKLEETTSR